MVFNADTIVLLYIKLNRSQCPKDGIFLLIRKQIDQIQDPVS